MPYCDDKRTIFLHIPKTGGTTISMLLKLSGLQDTNPSNRPTPQHLTCTLLREALGEKYDAYYKFTLVRNPWARLLSTYYWRQQLPKKRPVLAFEAFVEYAGEVVRTHGYYDQDFGDHFIPQVEYTRDIDQVFRYDAFEKSVQTVASRIGLSIPGIPPKEPKHYDDYRAFYTDKARALVASIYAEDIAEFDYAF